MSRALIWSLLLCAVLTSCRSTTSVDVPRPAGDPVNNSSSIKDGPIIYVALGDSTGAGVGAREGGYVVRIFNRLLTKRPGSRLVNKCVSGATTADVIHYQLKEGINANPTLVTLGIGINDIGHGVSLQEFAKNYQAILSQVKNRTNARVIVTNIPDISSAPQIPATMRQQYQQSIIQFNRKLEEIASRHGAVIFDVFSITHDALPSHPEYFSADGFHPSDKGYELWAEEMWPTVSKVAVGSRQ
ncbi:MAG TPA: SGNH/GDSL hydrolase family protein [Pyrinomonadaceae bacterium]